MREQIVAALRDHDRLNTIELSKAIGFIAHKPGPTLYPQRCDLCNRGHLPADYHEGGVVYQRVESIDTQPTLASMERHGEVSRWRPHNSAIWEWMRGVNFPESPDMADFEAALDA